MERVSLSKNLTIWRCPNSLNSSRNHDLPAYVHRSFYYEWMKNDVKNREKNLPTVIAYKGTKKYRDRAIKKFTVIWNDGYRS